MRRWTWLIVVAVLGAVLPVAVADGATVGAEIGDPPVVVGPPVVAASAAQADELLAASLLGDAGGAGFVSLTPARLVDSRVESPVGAYSSPWGPGETRTVDTAGLGGVPATGVDAVAVNVTTVGPTAEVSWLTIFETGTVLPANTAALNFGTGLMTDPMTNDLVISKVNTQGQFEVFNASGTVNLVIDVVGYFVTDGGADYHAVTPGRIVDSRADHQVGAFGSPWVAGQTRTVDTAGLAGVPSTGVDAVAVHVTTVGPTAELSWLTIHPTGSVRPLASASNFGTSVDSVDVTNDLVMAKVNDQGQFDVFNAHGEVDVVIDVVGYYGAEGARYVPLDPVRIVDSRASHQVGAFASPWGAGETRAVAAQPTGIEAGAVEAVAVHVTTVNPTDGFSWLTAFPPGAALPETASLNFGTEEFTTPITNDLVIAKVDANGEFLLANARGSVDVVIDIVGYFAKRTAIPGEFDILSPAAGSTVTAETSVVVNYRDDAGIERIEVRAAGQVVGQITAPALATRVTFDTAGPVTLDLVSVGAAGEMVTHSVEVNARVDLVTLESMSDAYEAGQLTIDEYLVAALPVASTTVDETEPVSEESTMVVFTLLADHVHEATPETQAALMAMNQVITEAVPQGNGVATGQSLLASDCPRRTWLLGRIYLERMCEYRAVPTDGSTPIRWLVEPDTYNSGAYIATLDDASAELWRAEAKFKSYQFELPEAHRDGVDLTIFVVDKNQPAYSSPFYVRDTSEAGVVGTILGDLIRDYGHPIRLRDHHLRNGTSVHELFHTFEWNWIDWTLDVGSRASRNGRTVAMYESAANWGTHQHFVAHPPPAARDWEGYGVGSAKAQWLADPTKAFLEHPDGLVDIIRAKSRAYAYFPGLVWLDQHAGVETGESSGFVRELIKHYETDTFGDDPWDVIRAKVGDGPQAHDGKPLAVAWPRMWTALYLMKDAGSLTAAERPIYDAHGWAEFTNSEVDLWVAALEKDPSLSDSYGRARPGRVALVDLAVAPIPPLQARVEPGGAAFFDFVMLPGTGSAVITVSHDRGGDHDRFEAIAMQFDPSLDLILCGGNILSSDPDVDAKTVEFVIDYNPQCPKVTIGIIHVNLDSGFGDPSDDGAVENFTLTATATTVVPEPELKESLPDATSGSAYNASLIESVGTPSFTFAVSTTVGLPPGLTIDTTTGTMSGTPEYGSSATIFATLEDDLGQVTSASINLAINGPKLNSATLPSAKNGDPYAIDLGPLTELGPDGTAIATYAVTESSLPPGLSIDAATGVISGTPTAPGLSSFTIQVTNLSGAWTNQQFQIIVDAVGNFLQPSGVVPTNFGLSLALGEDGMIVVVTTGRLYLFTPDGAGGYTESTIEQPADVSAPIGGGPAINASGQIVVGTFTQSTPATPNPILVFTPDGAGGYTHEQITITDELPPSSLRILGGRVDIADDGTVMVPTNDLDFAGVIYVFTPTVDGYDEQKILSPNGGSITSAGYGTDMSSNGTIAFWTRADGTTPFFYVWERTAGVYTQVATSSLGFRPLNNSSQLQINAAGVIVATDVRSSGIDKAVVYTPTGGGAYSQVWIEWPNEDVGIFPAGARISDTGTIVLRAFSTATGAPVWRYEPDGSGGYTETQVDLDLEPDFVGHRDIEINSAGTIIAGMKSISGDTIDGKVFIANN